MPNWCNNTLYVTGSPDDLRKFVETANGHGHDYYGPLNSKDFPKENEEVDDSVFCSLMMELMMRDDGPPSSADKRTSPLCFHSLYPVPKEVMLSPYDPNAFQRAKEKYTDFYQKYPTPSAGYDWEYNHWGVKWGACDATIYDENLDSGEVYFEYDSAWGPPSDTFFLKVSTDFPTLTFQNQWGGAEMSGGGGSHTYHAGEMTEWDEWDEDEEEGCEDDYQRNEEPSFEEGEEYQHDDSIVERES